MGRASQRALDGTVPGSPPCGLDILREYGTQKRRKPVPRWGTNRTGVKGNFLEDRVFDFNSDGK